MLASINYSSKKTDSIISKCTQLKPTERYRNIDELHKDISFLINPDQKYSSSNTYNKYLFPGFRSKTPWKILIASLSYLFIAWLCLTLEIKNTYGAVLWIERIATLLMMLSIIFCCFNYLDIQKALPLCQHHNRFIRYFAIALLNILIIFGLFILLSFVEIFFVSR